ncbi:potassium transporter TrkG [Sphingomonas sp.]|uniref:potassium transporter TrkG n=1 Tax=Sphingomonas sp. TaxID=28214 RepID=UPI002B529101|nr:potassium transporter TrkG [Sphingomonas sp.]HTG39756.1 potassium transporter TrkG [Sphingomonas sp.]
MQLRGIRHPTRLVPVVFLLAILCGTVLLALPVAREGAGSAPLITALFTATSTVAVTGLITVDTGTYWSPFGQVIILVLFQIGGFGIMTAATLLGLVAGRGFRLSNRLLTQTERNRLETGDAVGVLKLVFAITLIVELAVAAALSLRFRFGYSQSWAEAAWNGGFHAVSAFNNAGFSIFSDSLMGFQSDAVVLVPIMLAVVITALGFPVMQEVRMRALEPRAWSLHTKITVSGTIILLIIGFVAILRQNGVIQPRSAR